jgi:hypothetical protein
MGIRNGRVPGKPCTPFKLELNHRESWTEQRGQYLIAPYDAIRARAQSDGTTVATSPTDNTSQAATAARSASIAIVFINADSGEGYITVEGHAGDRFETGPSCLILERH